MVTSSDQAAEANEVMDEAAEDAAARTGEAVAAAGRPNAAFFYHPDGYDTSRPKLVGRHAAGEGFLKGFVRHSGVGDFHCHALKRNSFDHFQKLVGGVMPDAAMHWITPQERPRLAGVGTLFIPGPGLGGEFAWARRRVGDRAYSLCGVFHTTATHAIMDAMRDVILDPVQSWDAIVCTSRVVRDSMGRVLDGYRRHFSERLGATTFTLPQLPVIPLGVECDDMKPDKGARNRWRKKLGIGKDDVMVLFVGRLSFYEKAHPLAMYLGLEQAAEKSKRKVHLVEAGWFPNDKVEESFKEAIDQTCKKVKHHIVDGREADARKGIWHAADVFCSLSDNIQETFGLTPIEAMAAGLPVVVTDWDGYKDTVRNGEDGFRIRTLTPAPGLGQDIADSFFEGQYAYGRYCGYASQMTALDVPGLAEAFHRLVEDKSLRRQMGEAGRKRAREAFDWRVVVGQYQELWAELEARRRAGQAPDPKVIRHPGREDPFKIFQSYPSATLRSDHRVSLPKGASSEQFTARAKLNMVSFAKDILSTEEEIRAVVEYLSRNGSTPAVELTDRVPPQRRKRLVRSLLWMAKHDLVRISEP